MKISMSTLSQITKPVRYMKFKMHSMQESNKKMLDKALVMQTYDPTISTLDSIVIMPFD